MTRLGRFGLLLGCSLGILGSCGKSSAPTSGEPVCTPGASKACTCDGSPGAKTCDDHGVFGVCVCTGGAGRTAGSSGSTGLSNGGTSGTTSGTGGASTSNGGSGGTAGGAGGASTSKGDSGGAAGGSGGSATSSGGTGGSGSGGTGGSTTRPRQCSPGCTSAANCAIPNAPANDADNYACQNGACVYTGCLSDSECSSQNPGTVCRLLAPINIKNCIKSCKVPADCAQTAATYDADNYTCDSGACVYHGCNNDAECNKDYPGRVCRSEGTGDKSCYQTCTVAKDCALSGPAFDADNFACQGGICTYLGCNSDAECAAQVATYVCR